MSGRALAAQPADTGSTDGSRIRRRWSAVRALTGALLGAALLAGCATAPETPVSSPSSPSGYQPTGQPATRQPATGQPESPSGATTMAPHGGCLTTASELSLEQQVGQLYMMAIQVGTPIETAITQLQGSQAGAVILLGNWTTGLTAIAQYTEQLHASQQLHPDGSRLPVLVAADQEGGLVQRLQGPGFDTIPPATEQAQLGDAELRGSWQRWGRELRNAGVTFNLAPVADVVPTDQVADNAPIGQLQRGFGPDAEVVGRQVSQVVRGLSDARVASSVKHFPGLGRVNENTDFDVAHDTVSTASEAELASFQAAIDAGASSVMVSSAIYDLVDPDNPAVFSTTIIEDILRDRMGFDGVVISDDLGVAASVAQFPVAERGNMFLSAGGDMVIVADAAAARQMVAATLALARDDQEFAESLTAKVARLLALKQGFGLVACA